MIWFLIFAIVVVWFVGWRISLSLHPFRACPACKGTGRHTGSIFTWSHRRCRRCGGGGRQNRHGALWGFAPQQNLPGKGRGGA